MKWKTKKNVYLDLLAIGIALMAIGFVFVVLGLFGLIDVFKSEIRIADMLSSAEIFVNMMVLGGFLELVGTFLVPIMTYLLLRMSFDRLKEIKNSLYIVKKQQYSQEVAVDSLKKSLYERKVRNAP